MPGDVKEESVEDHSELSAEPGVDATPQEPAEASQAEDQAADAEVEDAEVGDVEVEDAEMSGREDEPAETEGAVREPVIDPSFDQTLLKPLFERREKSLKELLESMDEFAPIIPDAVTDYYLTRSGLKTNDQRIKRLLALATQRFISDIANDAYQYSRIRAQAGTSTGSKSRGNQGASSGRTVLTMESLSGILGDYGINMKRPDFYR